MATIKDVARLAGVGMGTASRAISGRGPVSADALARVNHAVAALRFRPSNVARALSTKTAGMVGIYVPDFAGDFYGPILQTVDSELRAVNRHMVAANGCGNRAGNGHGANDPRQQALDGIRFLIDRECDGVLAMSNALQPADFDALWALCPRLVLLNQHSLTNPDHCFSADHELAGRLAARALLARGHRELACISGPPSAPDNQARMAGFHDEWARARVRIPKTRQAEGDFTFAGGHAAADTLLDKGIKRGTKRFTGLFCANDVMAMAAISRINQAGLRVPGDLSVMGFDDSVLASYTTPGLSTIRIPIVSAAASGCRFLLNLCYGLVLPVQREFPPEVVWRDSVGDGPHGRPELQAWR
jgi:LacI family transcriptional regulator